MQIDENIFDEVWYILKQCLQKNDGKQQIERTTKGSTMLSGNIYCAHCGKKMVSTSHTDNYTRADGTACLKREYRHICTAKAVKREKFDGQSSYVAQKIDKAVTEILKSYLSKIKLTPKDIALEKCYKSEIAEPKKKQNGLQKEIEKLKRQVVELSAEVGKFLIGESRFTPYIFSVSIKNTNELLKQKETELNDINYKLQISRQRWASLITATRSSGHGQMNLKTRQWNRKR